MRLESHSEVAMAEVDKGAARASDLFHRVTETIEQKNACGAARRSVLQIRNY